MKHSVHRAIVIVIALGLLAAAVLRILAGPTPDPGGVVSPIPDPRGAEGWPRVTDPLEAPGSATAEHGTGGVRRVAELAGPGVPSTEKSVAEALLCQLRELAAGQEYHAHAWKAMERTSDTLRQLAPEVLLEELSTLEQAVRSSTESDLVRGACLVVLALTAPPTWFEKEFPTHPSDSPEMERAAWLATCQGSPGRSHQKYGQADPPGGAGKTGEAARKRDP